LLIRAVEWTNTKESIVRLEAFGGKDHGRKEGYIGNKKKKHKTKKQPFRTGSRYREDL